MKDKDGNNSIILASVSALMRFAFDELDMYRIEIRCGVGNTPSRKIPNRPGFRFEGIERGAELFPDGRCVDLEVYSRLRNDEE